MARQLPDTEQMNAAANKSIKSYIKTSMHPLPVTYGQRDTAEERREEREKR